MYLGFFISNVILEVPAVFNVWTHIAGTHDGATARLYINDQEVNSGSARAKGLSGNIFIGTRDGAQEFFKGQIDEVRLFNRTLTDGEVKTIHEVGSTVRVKA